MSVCVLFERIRCSVDVKCDASSIKQTSKRWNEFLCLFGNIFIDNARVAAPYIRRICVSHVLTLLSLYLSPISVYLRDGQCFLVSE